MTNDRSEGGLVSIPSDKEKWPEDWKVIEYKEYHRAKNIQLSKDNNSLLRRIIEKRNSDITTLIKQRITIEDIGEMLFSGYGLIKDESDRRTVPSGGARFPLELYVVIWGSVENLPKGIYHYDIKAHSLNVLSQPLLNNSEHDTYTNYEWADACHGMVSISSVFNRTVKKYGSRGYRYILLEAGHVAQNICLAAAERGLSVRPMGGVNESELEKDLQVDSTFEQVVYAVYF